MGIQGTEECYFFGNSKLCVLTRELTCDGKAVRLENKALDFLTYLIKNRDRAIPKDELQRVIWQNRPLSDTVMARCAMKARRAIQDDGQQQSVIKTIPGFGYRFIAEVRVENAISEDQQSVAAQRLERETHEHLRKLRASDPIVGLHDEVTGQGNVIATSTPQYANRDYPDKPQKTSGQKFGYAYLLEHYRKCIIIGVASFVIALASTFTYMYQEKQATVRKGNTIQLAVLPFQNATGDNAFDWVELGLVTLIEQSVAGKPRIQLMPSKNIVSALSQHDQPKAHTDTFKILRNKNSNAGDFYLLAASLKLESGVFHIDYSIQHPLPSENIFSERIIGDSPTTLAKVLGERVVTKLNRDRLHTPDADRRYFSDPLVQETFIRGSNACKSGKYRTAKRLLNSSLALDSKADWAKLELAIIGSRLGDWDNSENLFKEVLANAGQSDDDGIELAALSAYGNLEWRRGRFLEAENLYQKGVNIALEVLDGKYGSQLLTNLAQAFSRRGLTSKAKEMLNRSLTLSKRNHDRANRAGALQQLARIAVKEGQLKIAEKHTSDALYIRHSLYLPNDEAESLSEMGYIMQSLGRWKIAEVYYRQALGISRTLKDTYLEADILTKTAGLNYRLGKFNQSRQLLQEAQDKSTGNPNNTLASIVRLQSARMNTSLGQYSKAEASLIKSKTEFLSSEDDYLATVSTLQLGRLYLAQNQILQAKTLAENSYESGAQLNNLYLQTEAFRLQANIAHVTGKLDLADKLYREASLAAQSLGHSELIADVAIDLGYLCLERDRLGQAHSIVYSLKDRANYHRYLALKARLSYRIGNILTAAKVQSSAKKLAGQAWTGQEEKLANLYVEASRKGKKQSIDISGRTFLATLVH
ncbi:tetratricopeptide repeat protein [Pseudomonadota bacterium]